jgi:hypothetical protein
MSQNNTSDANKEITFYKDPKYSCGPNKNNDINSGSNPFYYCLPTGIHLIYETNTLTLVGQKYVTISRNTLPSVAAEIAASKIVSLKSEKKEFESKSINVKKKDTYYAGDLYPKQGQHFRPCV